MKDENKTNIDANNIIIVDADYLEEVTGILKGGFEKSLGRTFKKCDLAEWTDCVALDGGIEPGDNKTAVILFHDKNKSAMFHYLPCDFDKDLNDKAFKDNLGEFVYTSISVENNALRGEMIAETITVFGAEESVKRITVVADVEKYYKDMEEGIAASKEKSKENKSFTAVTMHIKQDWKENQVILGFSIMHTLGITDDDLKNM